MSGRRFLIEGRVQGVGFRRFVQRRADALGLTGWVRNRPDGRVEAEAFGEASCLEQFASDLATGPTFAHVTKVESQEISDEGDSLNVFLIVG